MPTEVCLEYGGLHVLRNTERCDRCGRHVGRERAEFRSANKPDRPFPLFATSDGFFVASPKFREFALESGFQGIEFMPLENRYFVVKVARCVAYDLSRIRVWQEDWCPACQTFRRNLVAVEPRPIAAGAASIGPSEIVESCQRWGVEVGERTAQGPDLIAGDEAAALLRARRFRGLHLKDTI